jgi:hypothetical protein
MLFKNVIISIIVALATKSVLAIPTTKGGENGGSGDAESSGSGHDGAGSDTVLSSCEWIDHVFFWTFTVVIDTIQDGGLCGGFFANLNFDGACTVSHQNILLLMYVSNY